MAYSGFGFSGLNLLSEVAVADLAGFGFGANTRASPSSLKSCDVAIQILMEFRVMKKKGLLAAHLEKAFFIPKKKRKRSGEQDGQIPRLKRRRTITGDVLAMPSRSHQEMNNKISSHVPLWSFQRKSPLRFSLIKLHLSAARTTAVS